MTKNEFIAVRRDARVTIRAAWLHYNYVLNHNESQGFLDDDRSNQLYAEFMTRLRAYAARLGCTLKQASDTLNLPPWYALRYM